MTRLLPFALVLALVSSGPKANAQGSDTPPAVATSTDAGVALSIDAGTPTVVGAGSSTTTVTTTTSTTPDSVTQKTSIAIPDPTKDPLGFYETLKVMWHTSWGVAIAVAVVGLLELLAWLGTRQSISWLAWLGVGRVSIVIGAASGILTTAIAAFATGGWTAFMTAIGGGILAFWHQGGTDPAKKENPVTIPTARVVK